MNRWEAWFYKLLVMGMVGGIGWCALDRTLPITVISDTVEGDVRAGGILVLRSELVRHRSCAMTVQQILIDGASYRHVLDDLNFDAAPGPLGHDVYRRAIVVRESAVPGYARFRIIVSWRCNPLHEIWPITITSEASFMLLPQRQPA